MAVHTRPVFAANSKMNHGPTDATAFFDSFLSLHAPRSDRTVIMFPSDEGLWLPQSRHIITTRADGTGTYQLSMIPSGEYLIVAVEDVEQGEWFDPSYLDQIRNRATKIKIDDGDQRTQDLKVASM